jgi:carboxylesterase type B
MGQSAGASSILHHITLSGGEKHAPDFNKAILFSPGFFPQPNPKQDDDTFEEFLALTGAENLSDLYSNAPEVATAIADANDAMTYNSSYGYFKFGPSIDGPGGYVPDLPGRLLADGKFHHVPVLVGYAKLDGLLFTPPWIRSTEDLAEHVTELFPSILNEEGVLDLLKRDYAITSDEAKGEIAQSADFFDVGIPLINGTSNIL